MVIHLQGAAADAARERRSGERRGGPPRQPRHDGGQGGRVRRHRLTASGTDKIIAVKSAHLFGFPSMKTSNCRG